MSTKVCIYPCIPIGTFIKVYLYKENGVWKVVSSYSEHNMTVRGMLIRSFNSVDLGENYAMITIRSVSHGPMTDFTALVEHGNAGHIEIRKKVEDLIRQEEVASINQEKL